MRIYYGWWIVAISLVLQMLTIGATMNTFGMYVVEASKDLGLSRANANTGLILISAGMAIFSPIVGRMLDVYPAREDPIPGVTGELVAQAARAAGAAAVTYVADKQRAPEVLAGLLRPGDLALTVGAGDVTAVGPAAVEAAR